MICYILIGLVVAVAWIFIDKHLLHWMHDIWLNHRFDSNIRGMK